LKKHKAKKKLIQQKQFVTFRERSVIRLLKAGLSNQEIADTLFLSIHTVKWYVRSILLKTNLKNRVGIARYANLIK
jgi:DNA-binding NarL/FixJ family response regulator